jgi:hypothetical protein
VALVPEGNELEAAISDRLLKASYTPDPKGGTASQ